MLSKSIIVPIKISFLTFLLSCSFVNAALLAGLEAYESKDYKTALVEFQTLAIDEKRSGQYHLGVMYLQGKGVIQDYKKAVKLFTLAAEQGYSLAQFILGVMYSKGRGVIQDYKQAVKWYTLAAEQGDSDAQQNLGVMYANGEGVIQDYVTAHMLANLSASNGNSPKFRDYLAKKMTPSQLEQAQQKAREWIEKHGN